MVLPTDPRPNDRPQSNPRYYRWGMTSNNYELSLQKVTPVSPFLLAIDHADHVAPIIWLELSDDQVYGLWFRATEHLLRRPYVDDEGNPVLSDAEVQKVLEAGRRELKGYES